MNAVTRVASSSAVVALVLATVWLFWPSGLGGGTTYVNTHGISMEPGFSTGDLAVLSSADSYSVGDVVAYRSGALDTIVMHRIVDEKAGHFVTQGDNNDWLDEDRPTQDQILGRLFFHIPQGGTALNALRSPAVFLPLLVVVGAVLAAGARKPPVRRSLHALRRRAVRLSLPSLPVATRAAGSPTPERTDSPLAWARAASPSTRSLARQTALGAAVVVLLAAVACGVLLAMPTTHTEARTLEVSQEGTYSYTGEAAPGTTYPTGLVATGDTVWNRLVDDLTVSLTSTVTGRDLADLTGGLRLDVVIAAPDGWTAVVNSGAAVVLQDGTATASVAVDTEAAVDLLDRHNEETGSNGGAAALTVTPVTDIAGTVQGQGFAVDPPTGLAFTLDEVALRPVSTEASAFTSTTGTEVEFAEMGERTFSVLALTVPVAAARMMAGAVLLLSLVTLCVAAWVARIGRDGVADSFLVRHADRILPVTSFSPGTTVIDVSDAESLHRVAERFDTVVLHHAGADEDTFAVRDVDATYRFVVPVGPDGRRGKPPVPAPRVADPVPPQPEPTDLTGPLGFRGLFA